jgi:hypothetical protein
MLFDVRLVEQSLIAKTGHLDDCEDGLVFTDSFAAVVDGATDKTGHRFDGVTSGRYAMRVVTDAIAALPSNAEVTDAVQKLTQALADSLPPASTAEDRPAAVAAVYSAERREVWQIGDVGYWFEGIDADDTALRRKAVDDVAIGMRVAVLTAALLRGASQEDLAENDIGREAILPLLRSQWVFSNNLAAGNLAYGVLNGLPVPGELVRVAPVPEHVRELVLASDGYPRILPTLAQTEENLKVLMARDPLCMGPLAGTKGLRPGAAGYDDRAYMRIEL